MMTRKQTFTVLPAALLVGIAVLFVVITQTPKGGPTVVNETTGQLSFVSQATAQEGQLAVDVKVVNARANSPVLTTSELVINFDPEMLTAVDITVPGELLSLNKNIDNANGIITIDIAKPSGVNFISDEAIASITFTAKSGYIPGAARISLDQQSTLGVPNILSESYKTTSASI